MTYKTTINQQPGAAMDLQSADWLHADWIAIDDRRFHLLLHNRSYNIELQSVDAGTKTVVLLINGNRYTVELKDEIDQLLEKMGLNKGQSKQVAEIKAPMPGLILSIKVAAGDAVVKGQPLIILEAMKMENVINAPQDCTIKHCEVEQGQAVEKGQVLLRLA